MGRTAQAHAPAPSPVGWSPPCLHGGQDRAEGWDGKQAQVPTPLLHAWCVRVGEGSPAPGPTCPSACVSGETTLASGPRSPDLFPENRSDLGVRGQRGTSAHLGGAPSLSVEGGPRSGSKVSPPFEYHMGTGQVRTPQLGSTFPEGQRRELGLEWMTHRGAGSRLLLRVHMGQRFKAASPHHTGLSLSCCLQRSLGALPMVQGSHSPGLRPLPLPQMRRSPWGWWVSVPMVLSFHPPSQCQQASRIEVTP